MDSIKRRDFIRKSAMAGGFLAGTSAISRAGNRPAAKPKSSDVIKVGLIGCGGRGTGAAVNALNAHEKVRMVALADTFQDKIDETLVLLKNEHADKVDVPPERQFVGFDAYLKLIDEVDVVLQATPPGFRPLHALAAAQAGKHMFLEKPVAVDVAGIDKMKEVERIANEKKLVVTVGLNTRYSAGPREHVKLIRDGVLGDIITTRGYGNFGRVSWLKNYDRSAVKTEMEFQLRNWYFFNWLSGDILVEQTVHLIDAVSWIKNDYPVEAQAFGGRHSRVGPMAGDVFDHFTVEYTYADGSKSFIWARQIEGTWKTWGQFAHGSLGYGEVGKELILKGKESMKIKERDRIGGHQREQNELFADIAEGRHHNDLSYGIPSTMMAILGRMAAYSGQVVKWDEAEACGEYLWPEDLLKGNMWLPMTWDTIPNPKPLEDMSYAYPMPGVTKPWSTIM